MKILRHQLLSRAAVLLVTLCVLWATGQAQAQEAATRPEQLSPGPEGTVLKILDGDTLVLNQHINVRLTGLNAPEIAHQDRAAEPFGPESRQLLEKLAKGQKVRLYYGGTRKDRYGRALAHIVRDDGLWLQEAMLKAGGARVYTFADNYALAAPMLAAEATARTSRKGVWALPDYQIQAARDDLAPLERFHIVRGTVRDVVPHRQWTFINFGDNWKTDFTATISGKDRKAFDKNRLNQLVGQEIELRGWVNYHNGPSMTLSHPAQISNW